MKHEDFINRIEGAYLKQEYLEAFLMQSTYIDGLIDFFIFVEILFAAGKVKKGSRAEGIRNHVQEKMSRETLYRKIDFLERTKIISKETSKKLHKYREKRNKVLHQIIQESDKEDFEQTLKKSYDLGQELIQGDLGKVDSLVKRMKKKINDEES